MNSLLPGKTLVPVIHTIDAFRFFESVRGRVTFAIIFGIIGFLLSYEFSAYYIAGDQEFYRHFYSEIVNFDDLASAFVFYKNTVGASEPGFLLMTVLLPQYFEKDLIYSVINGLLMGVSAFIILRRGGSLIILLFLIVNYYLMTLFFSAERLKVAILLFELAFLGSGYWRWLLMGASSLFQFQMAVPILCYLIWSGHELRALGLKRTLVLFLALLAVVAVVFYFSENLITYSQEKISYYVAAGWGGMLALIKPVIFLTVAVYYCEERSRLIYTIFPLLVATYFLGSERMTIFAFAIMLYMGSRVRHGLNLPVLCALAYFAFGGVDFLLEFIENGKVGD